MAGRRKGGHNRISSQGIWPGIQFVREHQKHRKSVSLCEICSQPITFGRHRCMRHRLYQPPPRGQNAVNVEELRKSNPCATMQDIASQVGLSRERVRQILNRDALPTRRWHPTYICQQCGEVITKKGRKRFCSAKCQYEYTHPLIECAQCGTLFRRSTHNLLNSARDPRCNGGHFFCNHRCAGKWRGIHQGFFAHPENARRHVRQYDYNAIWQKHLETGYGALRLSRSLGIPLGTMTLILRVMSKESTTVQESKSAGISVSGAGE